jgi:hypothetical protein
MATSGQTSAQTAQPVHSPLSLKTAGKKPLAFSLLEVDISRLGQKETQSSQPLHSSCEISIDPFTLVMFLTNQPSLIKNRQAGFAPT